MPRKKGDTKLHPARAMLEAKPVPVPEFVELPSEARAIWPVFIASRVGGDWQDLDLMLLARACILEVDIRRARRELYAMGFMVADSKGIPKLNPLVSVLDRFAREQMAILTKLNCFAGRGSARAGGGSKSRIYDGVFSLDEDNLLARPR